jgi:hypothetical protein
MDVKVKNKDLAMCYAQLSPNGLQSEKVSIGVKTRAQKIAKMLIIDLDAYNKSIYELYLKHGATETELDELDQKGKPTGKKNKKVEFIPKKGKKQDDAIIPEAFTKELDEFQEMENTYTFDPIDYEKIENVPTEKVYDFDLLSPFFENF